MHYTGSIYRPPLEANTPLLEVTAGCSWNRCSFCSMYQSTQFTLSPIEHIKEDIAEIKNYYSENVRKIFLVNGDAFVLPTEKLLEISTLIHEKLPHVEVITCYASIRNIKNKSVDELKQLRKAGYNYPYIGLESGDQYALDLMNKGYSSADEYDCLEKLQSAGIKYNALLMYGVSGFERSIEHVEETCKLLNTYKPSAILVTSTSVQENTPLADYIKDGKYTQLTERQLIEEEIGVLEELDMDDDCYYFGSHPFNMISVSDYFINRDNMISYINQRVKQIDSLKPGVLDTVQTRGSL